ncbi:MAG: helix-turn-helix domain-containing protein [Lachnospiraceae bacterium]|nr:helix-turn-helix domain-containing protein [Lachnospiraceae bacterium]
MSENIKEQILSSYFEADDLTDFLRAVSEIIHIPLCILDLNLTDPTRTDPPLTNSTEAFQAVPAAVLTSSGTKCGYLGIPEDAAPDDEYAEYLTFTAHLASKMPEVAASAHLDDSAFISGIKELLYSTNLSRMESLRAQIGLSRYKEGLPGKCYLINIVSLSGDTLMTNLKEKILLKCAREGDVLFNYGDSVLYFVMSRHKEGDSESDKAVLRSILKEENAIGCISDPFKDPVRDFRLRRFYNRNEEVLLYLKSKYSDRPGLLAEYDEYRIVALLMNALVNQEAFGNYQYICRTVMKIAEYDRNNNTDYVNTLRYYLSTNFSLQETARLIHVHRNTVAYRVRRMTELFGIDYSSSEQCFQLTLSLRLYDIAEHIT